MLRLAVPLAALAACTPTEPETPPPPAEPCGAGADPFSREALSADIEYLASDALEGRAPDTPGDLAARTLIEERFRCLGLDRADPGDSYQQAFVTSDDRQTANVVAVIPGTEPDEIVLVGGHHDHLGVKRDEIYNGANDNASGTATVLAVARWLAETRPAHRRTIALATFGYEEHDGKCEGSEYMAAHPPAGVPVDRIAYMVDADMLGTYPSEGVLTAYGALEGTPARDLLVSRLATDAPELDANLNRTAGKDDSDFQAFCNLGIPYLYFETWDRECYHRPCDDADRIDYDTLEPIARLTGDLVVDLANADDLMAAHGNADLKCAGD